MSIIKSNMTAPPPTTGGGSPILSDIGEMNSLRFDGSSYLQKTDLQDSGTIYTFSGWIKPSNVTGSSFQIIFSACVQGSPYIQDLVCFNSDNQLNHYQFSNANTRRVDAKSTAVFRDPNAWYHVVLSYDMDESISHYGYSTIYVNGKQVAQDTVSGSNQRINFMGSSVPHYIGNYVYQSNPGGAFEGYMANIQFIDGQALTPHYFGAEVSGIWVPKAFNGTSSDTDHDVSGASFTYGSNGFHLDFGHRGRTIIHRNNIEQGDSNHSLVFDPIPSQLGTKAICFNGPSDHALTVAPWLNLSGDLTLESWVNKNSNDGSVNDNRCLFSLDITEFYYRPASNGYHYYNNNTNHTSLFPSAQSGAGWEHVAFVRENGVWRVYLNGVRGTATHTDNATYSNNFLSIGGYSSAGDGDSFHGAMNHIRVSNLARYTSANIANYQTATSNFTTDSDTLLLITANENEGSGVTTFVDQSGSVANIGYDSSGNNNHWQAN
jgi:hypothetical protein